jgi:hypothetical protein
MQDYAPISSPLPRSADNGTIYLSTPTAKPNKRKIIVIFSCVIIAIAIAAVVILAVRNSKNTNVIWSCSLQNSDNEMFTSAQFIFDTDSTLTLITKNGSEVKATYDLSNNNQKYGFISAYDDEDALRDWIEIIPRFKIIDETATTIGLNYSNAVALGKGNERTNASCYTNKDGLADEKGE